MNKKLTLAAVALLTLTACGSSDESSTDSLHLSKAVPKGSQRFTLVLLTGKVQMSLGRLMWRLRAPLRRQVWMRPASSWELRVSS